MSLKQLIELREKIKKRRPVFRNQDSNKRPRIPKGWRAARGNQSKVRKGIFGKPKKPKLGYASPKLAMGIPKKGFPFTLISSIAEIEKVPEDKAVLIASKVGAKKRKEIIKKCLERGIQVINYKDPASWLERIEKSKAKAEKEKPKEEEKKEAPFEKPKLSPEEHKEKEREQFEKTIIKRV